MAAETPKAKLYVILGSHACRTGMLLLEHKQIPYETHTIFSGLHPWVVRLRGFPAAVGKRPLEGTKRTRALGFVDRLGTVPALAMGKDRIQGNRNISRYLEELQPDPPLFPADPKLRSQVEEAEHWGDEVFQMTARRLGLACMSKGPDAVHARGNEGRLGPILYRGERTRRVLTKAIARRVFAANETTEAELLEGLPAKLDRIDAWIEAGVLNGEHLNSADLMIAPSLALGSYSKDLRPEIERRPAGVLMDRVLPEPEPKSAVAV